MKINGFDTDSFVENQIYNALVSNRFPHTVIIEGGTAEQRSLLARKTARALVCNDGESRPCGSCSHCRKSGLDMHPDILFENPSKTKSGNLIYSVENIRNIRADAFVIPNEADSKVIILNESQLMNPAAQNAFLKILEEPPEFVTFLMLCSSKSEFIPTVLSRATVYFLGNGNELSPDFPAEKIIESASAMINAAASRRRYELVKASAAFEKNEKLLEACLPVMGEMFASALRIKYGAEENPEYECSANAASKMSSASLLRAFDGVNKITESMSRNANLNLTLVRICSLLK